MKYILTSKQCSVTGRALAKELGLAVRFTPRKGEAPTVRWGNSESPYPQDTKLSSPGHISLVASKVEFANFTEKHNLPSVVLTDKVNGNVIFPVLFRTLTRANQGRGIVVAYNRVEFNDAVIKGAKWFSPYIPFEFELRVHVLGGKPVRIFKKVLNAGEEEAPGEVQIRHNEKYHFSLRKLELYPKVYDLIEKTYAVLPMGMMGFDLGYDAVAKEYKIIEINSAPALSPNSLKLYVEYIRENL